MKAIASIVLSLLLMVSLAAQTPGAKQPDVKPSPAAQPPAGAKTTDSKAPGGAMEMPKPAPEIERLAKMLQGRWETVETHEKSEMMPGGTGKGQESVRPGPGKLSLISEYSSVGPAGEFAGIGIITWNPVDRQYYIHWTDNTSPAVTSMTGKWQGADLVFSGSDMVAGKKMFARHAFTDIKPDSFTYTIDVGPAANQLKRAVTINYTRVNMQDIMNRRMRGVDRQ